MYSDDLNNQELDSLEYNRFGGELPPPGNSYNIPDDVQNFLMCLYKAIAEKNVQETRNLYENTFPQLTDTYYKESAWPAEEDIASVIGQREYFRLFIILYKELYFRHIYANCQPTIEQRFDSYKNYCALFNQLLDTSEPINLELPNQWLWDIIDEFIYQFQSYLFFKKKDNKLEHEIIQMRENPKVWCVHPVLNVLHSLVEKSSINLQLKEYNEGRDGNLIANSFGRKSLYKMLGYFSLIGLLRLHSNLGDYYNAISVLEHVDHQRHLIENFSGVLACQTTTFYYVGFAYMMMKRYADAIRALTSILTYLQRNRQINYQYRTVQSDSIDKNTDRIYVLLNICLVLYPQRIDESISANLQMRLGDSMSKMQRGDLGEFKNAFLYACPKFFNPAANPVDADGNEIETVSVEAHTQQSAVFMEEIIQQIPILIVRSYLKLYTTMSISKLAAFLEKDELSLRLQLLAYKHKMRNMICVDSSVAGAGTKGGLDGEFVSSSDIDFYIDQDMIHIADTKVQRRYADYFLRQINHFEDLYGHVSAFRLQQPKKVWAFKFSDYSIWHCKLMKF